MYLGRAKPERLVDEMMNELSVSVSCTVPVTSDE